MPCFHEPFMLETLLSQKVLTYVKLWVETVNGEGKNFQFPGLIGRAFFFACGKGTRTLQRFKYYYRDLSITESWAGLGRWGGWAVKEKVLHSSCFFPGFHKKRIFPVLESWQVEHRNLIIRFWFFFKCCMILKKNLFPHFFNTIWKVKNLKRTKITHNLTFGISLFKVAFTFSDSKTRVIDKHCLPKSLFHFSFWSPLPIIQVSEIKIHSKQFCNLSVKAHLFLPPLK